MPNPDKQAQAPASTEPEETSQDTQPAEKGAPESPQHGADAPDVEALQQELEEARAQSRHHLDQWKRSAANLENYRKHVEKERADLVKLTKASVIVQILPVLDDLDRAFATIPFDLRSFTWTEGLALIDRKLQAILEQQGLEEIDESGVPFDPTQHQAMLEEHTDEYSDGHVMAILQKGYKLDGRVLRPALVKIARGDADREKRGAVAETEPAVEESPHLEGEPAEEDSSEDN